MTSFLQVFLGLLLVSCVHGQAPLYLGALYARCSNASVTAAKACTTTLESVVAATTPGQFHSSPSSFCRNRTAMGSFSRCLNETLNTCLPPGLLPTETNTMNAWNFYCNTYNDTNLVCISEQYQTNPCLGQALFSYAANVSQAMGLSQASWNQAVTGSTCVLMNIMRGCAYAVGGTCPRHRLDYYDTYWAMSYPPVCTVTNSVSGVPTSFLFVGACVLLNKMAAIFWW